MVKIRVSTKKINDLWFKKTKITQPDGTPEYSYHYRRKSENPSKIIIWNTYKAKQLLAYQAIAKDLKDTLATIKQLHVLHHLAIERKDGASYDDKVALKALMTFIIVTYAKCFISGRYSRLNAEVILKNSKYIAQHNIFIDMRHKYFAHAGESIFESSRLIIPFPPLKQRKKEKGILISPVSELIQTAVDKTFANDYEPLALEVLQYVNKKMEGLSAVVMQEVADLGQEEIEKLIRRCGSKPSITYNGKVRNQK